LPEKGREEEKQFKKNMKKEGPFRILDKLLFTVYQGRRLGWKLFGKTGRNLKHREIYESHSQEKGGGGVRQNHLKQKGGGKYIKATHTHTRIVDREITPGNEGKERCQAL